MTSYKNVSHPWLKLLLAVALIPISIVLAAYTISVLWGWFVAPLFGLPALTNAQAYGLTLVVAAFKSLDLKKDENKDFDDTLVRTATAVLLKPVFLLGLGWALRAWFM